MMMSPCSRWGTSWSMNASTAEPALTSKTIFRGFLSLETSSSTEWAPWILVPGGGTIDERLARYERALGRNKFTLGLVCEEMVDFARRAVVCDDVEAFVVHVEDEVLTLFEYLVVCSACWATGDAGGSAYHDGQTDEADIAAAKDLLSTARTTACNGKRTYVGWAMDESMEERRARVDVVAVGVKTEVFLLR